MLGEKLLSYKQCEKGYEYYDNGCRVCHPGFYKNSISDTYHTDYSDDYQHNSMQHHLSLSDMDEDDIY